MTKPCRLSRSLLLNAQYHKIYEQPPSRLLSMYLPGLSRTLLPLCAIAGASLSDNVSKLQRRESYFLDRVRSKCHGL